MCFDQIKHEVPNIVFWLLVSSGKFWVSTPWQCYWRRTTHSASLCVVIVLFYCSHKFNFKYTVALSCLAMCILNCKHWIYIYIFFNTLSLELAMKAQRFSTGTALLFLSIIIVLVFRLLEECDKKDSVEATRAATTSCLIRFPNFCPMPLIRPATAMPVPQR